MSHGFDYDAAIIGGGSGGYAAARTLAAGGKKVAVVEGGKEVGGLCILRGCMPTKALLHAADVLHQARKGSVWGLKVETAFDFKKVMARKDSMVGEFASYRRGQLESGRFQFIRAFARFRDPHSLELDNGQTITAENIIISTGSRIGPPPIPGLLETGYITSDEALHLEKPPSSLIVLGGGAVAVEFAQFFSRFDVKVTLLQRSANLVRDFDTDAASEIEKVFLREGMGIHTGCKLIRAERRGGLKCIVYEQNNELKEAIAEEIFFGLGRVGNIDRLNLEAAQVASQNSQITTNNQMQTTAPHIYAAGDCTGPYEIVHLAIQQGEIAAHNILHLENPRQMDYRLLINIVFTDPQIASVGLTEKAARAQSIPTISASYPFNDHGKSMIMDAMDGFVKIVADPKTGEILGASCVGPMGGELLHEMVVAMQARMTVQQLASTPHYHPTLAEIWTYPAEELSRTN